MNLDQKVEETISCTLVGFDNKLNVLLILSLRNYTCPVWLLRSNKKDQDCAEVFRKHRLAHMVCFIHLHPKCVRDCATDAVSVPGCVGGSE